MADCRKFFPLQVLAYNGLNCSNVLLTILGGQQLTTETRKHLIVIFNYLHNITNKCFYITNIHNKLNSYYIIIHLFIECCAISCFQNLPKFIEVHPFQNFFTNKFIFKGILDGKRIYDMIRDFDQKEKKKNNELSFQGSLTVERKLGPEL